MVGVPEGVPSYMFWQVFFIATILPAVILRGLSLLNLIAPSSKIQRDKIKPIECGFEDQLKGSRTPFSIYFFTLAVLFLVFDVETVLLFPCPIALNFFIDLGITINIFGFVLILLVGLIHETRQGALKWA